MDILDAANCGPEMLVKIQELKNQAVKRSRMQLHKQRVLRTAGILIYIVGLVWYYWFLPITDRTIVISCLLWYGFLTVLGLVLKSYSPSKNKPT
jgi:predicted membrane channel-forming protein YqfA (hemolysin III family)